MAKKFREGSMGAAEQKSTRKFLIVATIIVAFIMSMIFLGVPRTFFRDYYINSGGGFWGTAAHVSSFISFLGCIVFMWFGKDLTWGEKGGWQYGVISGILLVAGILLSAGFNFTLK